VRGSAILFRRIRSRSHQLRQLANRATLEIGELVETFHRVHSVPGCDNAKLSVYAPHRKNRYMPSVFLGNNCCDRDHIPENEKQRECAPHAAFYVHSGGASTEESGSPVQRRLVAKALVKA
jgi:hypothetical protein